MSAAPFPAARTHRPRTPPTILGTTDDFQGPPTFTSSLRPGTPPCRANRVLQQQLIFVECLNKLGRDDPNWSNYGPRTTAAVVAFKVRYGRKYPDILSGLEEEANPALRQALWIEATARGWREQQYGRRA